MPPLSLMYDDPLEVRPMDISPRRTIAAKAPLADSLLVFMLPVLAWNLLNLCSLLSWRTAAATSRTVAD